MTVIRELFVFLGIDADEQGMKKADAGLDRITTAAKAAVTAVGAIAGGLGFGALISAVDRQARLLERFRNLTGASVEELDALRFAAEALGGNGEKALEGIVEAAERASDVVLNIKALTGDAGESFKALGFRSVRELTKANGTLRDAPELFEDLIDRLSKVESQGVRTGIAMRLFGDDTGQAIASLDLARLQDLRSLARELGVVMGGEDVAAAQRFRAEFGLLGVQVEAVRNRFVLGVLPTLSRYLVMANRWWAANGKVIRQGIDRWVQRFNDAVSTAGDVLDRYGPSLERFASILGTLASVLAGGLAFRGLKALGAGAVALGARFSRLGRIAGIVGRAFARGGLSTALRAVGLLGGKVAAGAALVAGKLALIGAAIGAVLLVADDIVTFFQGGDSYFGDFIAWLGTLDETIRSSAGSALEWFLGLFFDAPDEIAEAKAVIVKEVEELFDRIHKTIQRQVDSILLVFGILWEGLKRIWGQIATFVGGVADRVAAKVGGVARPVVSIVRALGAEGLSNLLDINTSARSAARAQTVLAGAAALGAPINVQQTQTNIIQGNATPEAVEGITKAGQNQNAELKRELEREQ